MKIAIVGGGIAGSSAALYLAKAGHDITLFERDQAQQPAQAADAFEWERKGIPQIRHSHAMLALMRNLLRDDHPEVYKLLLDTGATEMKLYEDMPGFSSEAQLNEDDKDIVMLACRRATLEWVLRTSVEKKANIEIVSGADITGLSTSNDNPKQVNGVIESDGKTQHTDLVIVADGRRSSVPNWLEALGLSLQEDAVEPAGIVYYSRFYKLDQGKQFPTTSLVANDLGYLFYAAFCGDNGYFSTALSANEDDHELRKALLDPDFYDAAVRKIPELQPWVESGTPTTEIFPMSGLVNRRRHFCKDGKPVVTGLHVIGDALVTTNPAYGRGVSLALWQGKLVADCIAEHPENLAQQSLAFAETIESKLVPWFDISVFMDSSRRQEKERLAQMDDSEVEPENPMKSLHDAANIDPDVWRMFWRAMNLLDSPDTLMSPEFLEKIAAVGEKLASQSKKPEATSLPPDRDALLGLATET